MSTDIYTVTQATTETRTHYIDFTNDLPDGVTVSSATATHTPPSGGTAITPTVGVIASNVVPVTLTTPAPAGQHILSVLAMLSNGDTSAARLIVQVDWTSVRSGMADLILRLRGMTDAGATDYQVAGAYYWSDKHLQDILDANRAKVRLEPMQAIPSYGVGTVLYTEYLTGLADWENSPTIQDSTYGTVSSSGYTFDAITGAITFTADQAGSARYITGAIYDLPAAAAMVWRKKAAHYAGMYDISTDNHSLKRSQLVQHCLNMAAQYETQGGAGVIQLERGDNVTR